MPISTEILKTQAEAVLRANDRGTHTVPSARLYPHQWAWDSGFAAIGWSLIDVDRALAELERLLEFQWDDGRVPHIVFDTAATDYFPGPGFWEHERTSSITNPPIWTIAARIIQERGGDQERIAALAPKLEASHQFFASNRDPLAWGGVAVAHPWESGRDNCPSWDQPLQTIDPKRAPSFRRVDRGKVADPSQRPTDDHYKRYAALVKSIAADGFGPGEFAVYDPFMTAVLIRAETDLLWLAERYQFATRALERRERATNCLRHRLWDTSKSRCRFHDARQHKDLSPKVLASLAPAVCRDDELAALCEKQISREFDSLYGLPTVARSSTSFDPRCYWRGPVWLSTNWLFATAVGGPLRDAIIRDSTSLVQESGFWEYFDPENGSGLGASEFTWTAALILDLLAKS